MKWEDLFGKDKEQPTQPLFNYEYLSPDGQWIETDGSPCHKDLWIKLPKKSGMNYWYWLGLCEDGSWDLYRCKK